MAVRRIRQGTPDTRHWLFLLRTSYLLMWGLQPHDLI